MTITTPTGTARTASFATLIAALGVAVVAGRRHRDYGASAAELRRLDDRGLADIGLAVADVPAPPPIEASARTLDQVVLSVGDFTAGEGWAVPMPPRPYPHFGFVDAGRLAIEQRSAARDPSAAPTSSSIRLRGIGNRRFMARELVSLAKNPVPSGARTGAFASYDGAELRYAIWQASRSPRRGTVCLFGGRSEFIEKYFEVVADLRRRGFAVATMDWRGQGGSVRELPNRRKGYVADFACYDEDLKRFMRDIVLPDCPPPFVALGHSMGGNIVLRSAAMAGVWWEKVVVSAPMIRLNPVQLPVSRPTAELATRLICRLGGKRLYVPRGSDDYGEHWPFEDNPLTSDRERFARNNAVIAHAPELGLGSPTFGWLRAAFDSMNWIARRDYAEAVHVPVLFAIAGEDRIAHAPAIEDFAARLKLSRSIVIHRARHEILQERDELRQQFWAAFDAYVGSEGPR